MLVSIGSYAICDGTLAGGVAVGDLRLRVDRIFDVVVPINDVSPVLFDRITSKSDITFSVYRTFDNINDSEDFLLELEENLPRTGNIQFTSGSGLIRYIPNGSIVDYSLVKETGATMLHTYHIIGGPTGTSAPSPPPPAEGPRVRWVYDAGPPAGIKLQIENSSDVWEDIIAYHAST